MIAEAKKHIVNEDGQTLLELVFLIPVLFTFVILLFKSMMAVQMAINNAQFSRSQIYMLTANQPEYPRLQFRMDSKMFIKAEQDRMILGVADIGSTGANNEIEPVPQTYKIALNSSSVKGSSERGEVKKRTEIRIRDTAAICTQLNGTPVTSNERWPFKREVCRYKGMI
jgi:hypothetical protein